MHQNLATSSAEDGLDFACNLAVSGILAIAEQKSAKAPVLLRYLAQYVQFRYVNQLVLALEYLADIGNMLEQGSFSSDQFWAQMRWLAQHMDLDLGEYSGLRIPRSGFPA